MKIFKNISYLIIAVLCVGFVWYCVVKFQKLSVANKDNKFDSVKSVPDDYVNLFKTEIAEEMQVNQTFIYSNRNPITLARYRDFNFQITKIDVPTDVTDPDIQIGRYKIYQSGDKVFVPINDGRIETNYVLESTTKASSLQVSVNTDSFQAFRSKNITYLGIESGGFSLSYNKSEKIETYGQINSLSNQSKIYLTFLKKPGFVYLVVIDPIGQQNQVSVEFLDSLFKNR